MRQKISTNIVGLDKMLSGGIPLGNQVIVEGGPGSGKTLLCFEYLYKGAKAGENGVMFSFEEEAESIINNAKAAFTSFTDIDDLIKQGKITILGSEETKLYMQKNQADTAYSFGNFISEITSVTRQHNAKRIALDSISVIKLFITDMYYYRSLSISLLSVLTRQGITSLITMESIAAEKTNTFYQPESFIYDGLILLFFTGKDLENRIPSIEIVKMRGTDHIYNAVPYEITQNGFNILLLNAIDKRSYSAQDYD